MTRMQHKRVLKKKQSTDTVVWHKNDNPGFSQPRSQGHSSSRPRKRERGDPGLGWSRVSQNLGDYK